MTPKTTEKPEPKAATQNDRKKKEKPEAPPPGGIAHWKMSLAIVLGWLAIDHATKFWAIAVLKPEWWGRAEPTAAMWANRPDIPIIPGLLRFVYAENTGAAFSMLYGRVTLLGIISLVAIAGLVWFWRQLPAGEKWGRAAVALIVSGAIGNMIDRFARGYVVDFIDAYWGQYHWPTFNIADSCICVGAGILAVLFLKGRI